MIYHAMSCSSCYVVLLYTLLCNVRALIIFSINEIHVAFLGYSYNISALSYNYTKESACTIALHSMTNADRQA